MVRGKVTLLYTWHSMTLQFELRTDNYCERHSADLVTKLQEIWKNKQQLYH